ncbi:NEAT domain-containing protein [Niallia sp. Man26]|uniref:NEAT domain-containing protein n=1 Tax=Niallia sp. Man26 TaxID=2912824 RepID=UPI0020485D8F|nr:NEAT domain-containing protein [Niallia sp. Man26]UPO88535.1 NEAT domain-containing protein [Niallia sp. Man26]
MKAAKIALAFLVIVFSIVSTVIPLDNRAYAAELNSSTAVADGEYSIGYTILHATNDEASMADQYYTKPGKLIIKDGQAKVQVEYSNYITEFKVNGTPVTKIGEAGDKTTAEFPVADLEGLTEAEIHVEVPAISYDHWYTVRFDFDTASLPVQTEPSEEAEEPATTPENPGEEAEEPATTPENPGEEAEEPATTPENPGEEQEEPVTTPENPGEEQEEPVTTPENPGEEQEEAVTTPENPGEEAGESEEETPAAPQEDIVYEDGEYEVDYTVLHGTAEEKSIADNYFTKPSKVIVKDGNITVQTEYSSLITEFTVNGENPTIISNDGTKTVAEFQLASLNSITEAQIHVEIPAINYDHWYNVRFDFNTENLPVLEEKEPLADGTYTIDYKVWKENADEASSMGNYLSKPAKLIVENGKTYIQLNLSSSNFVTGFKAEVNGEYVDADVISEDAAANTKVLRFEVQDLSGETNIQLAMSYGMSHVVRMVFDEGSVVVSEPEENPEPSPGEGEEEPLADGTYTIDYKVWKENADEASSMGNYLSKPAKLIVENGKTYIQLNLSSSNFVTGFKAEVNGEYVGADVISQDAAANTKVLRFEVQDLSGETNIQLAMSYGMSHVVRMVFDESSISVDDEGENPGTTPGEGEGENPGTTPGEGEGENPGTTPGEGEGENPGTTPGEGEGENPGTTPGESEGANSQFVDGEYQLDYSILHALQNEKSMADQYFTKPGKVTLKNGNATVQVEFNDYITEFKINGKEAEIISQSAGKTVVQFAVADLTGLTSAEIHVEVPAIGYDHWYTVRFDYDTSKLPTKSGDNGNGTGGNEEGNGNGNEEKPEENPGNVDEDKEDGKGDKGENTVLKDGEYTVDYSVLHASNNEKSMADSYFVKPGKLIVKDGKVVARLTVNTEFITEFLVGSKAVTVISKSGNSTVVEFPVADLANPTVGNIHVVIPELNYDHWYEIRFLFDVSDLPVEGIDNDFDQINHEDTNAEDGTTDNGENLEFNRDGDTTADETKTAETTNKVINAKTGDTAQIALYLSLLLISLAVLVRKYRKRSF